MPRKAVILGAAGRDFHNFNAFFRSDPSFHIVAFTAAQLPEIAGRTYPPELAGDLYPEGIPIMPEEDLSKIIRENGVEIVIFAYSDVSYPYVMERASISHASGADFLLLGPKSTMLKSNRPVVAVTAARTGAGKSQTSRRISRLLKERGRRFVVVRHPMPYGDLRKQAVQRFVGLEDLDRHGCTIEEREDYEPHLMMGNVVFAGVDYQKILKEAEREAEIILWDGGNNDLPFYLPDLMITVVDPLRAGHELTYWPGSVNVRMADVVVINKVDTASRDQVKRTRDNVLSVNRDATIIEAASPIFVDKPDLIRGKRVVVLEDGPTITHGEMSIGAGYIASKKYGASEVVDPRPWIVGSIGEVYEKYAQIGPVLASLGYTEKQVRELEGILNSVSADSIVIGTPTDLSRYLDVNKPTVHVKYELEEIGKPDLGDVIDQFLEKVE